MLYVAKSDERAQSEFVKWLAIRPEWVLIFAWEIILCLWYNAKHIDYTQLQI